MKIGRLRLTLNQRAVSTISLSHYGSFNFRTLSCYPQYLPQNRHHKAEISQFQTKKLAESEVISSENSLELALSGREQSETWKRSRDSQTNQSEQLELSRDSQTNQSEQLELSRDF